MSTNKLNSKSRKYLLDFKNKLQEESDLLDKQAIQKLKDSGAEESVIDDFIKNLKK